MDSQVSPINIEQRAEALVKPAEEVVAPAPAAPEVKAEVKPEVKAEVKPEVKVEKADTKVETKSEPNAPNDPKELRKWATKASQENAALRDEIKAVKAAIEKMTKKPIDYKELAKNPEAIQKQIELERQEAIAEMQEKLNEKTNLALTNQTVVEKMKREQDSTNYPEWKRVFPLIQNLAANSDGRVNFNQDPGAVLDSLYELAMQLSPKQIAEVAQQTPPAPVQSAPVKSAEEIAAEIAAAEQRGFEKAQAALRAEQNGGGVGSAGKGGRRSSGVTKEALRDMPLKDLKALINPKE